MYISTLVHRLVLALTITSSIPSCVEDPAALGAGATLLTAEDETIDYLPQGITRDQLDADGRVVEDKLACGLSVLAAERGTDFWFRSCDAYDALGEIVVSGAGGVYSEATPDLAAYRTVSGTARGRVLKIRTRKL